MTSHYLRYILEQTDEIQYRKLCIAYSTFVENADKPEARCIKVFSPMSNKVLAELELIREVSKELQEKKDADMTRRAKMLEDGESEGEDTADSGAKSTNN